jgi:hypothetical protein
MCDALAVAKMGPCPGRTGTGHRKRGGRGEPVRWAGETARKEIAMLPGSAEFQIAEMRSREWLTIAARERLARQAEGTVKATRVPQPALVMAIRYTHYVLTSLAAVAFALSNN